MSFWKKKRKPVITDETRDSTPAGSKKGAQSAENPYLTARRTWNEHVGSVVSQKQTWQFIGILSMLISLAAVGGIVHIGSQSKFIPYVVQVDKLGQSVASGPLEATNRVDPRVMHATLAEWLSCARMVTPDVPLQRKCVFKVYAMLNTKDPATAKMNEWLNGSADSNPFKRAGKEMVSIEMKTVIPQTPDTWQVEWTENTRDRNGILKTQPVIWRALITTYIAESSPQITDEQLRNNPLSIYVRDFSWARVQ